MNNNIAPLSLNDELLKILLKDMSSGKNIIWGTSDYGYDVDIEIKIEQIIGDNENIIIPRALKSKDEQKKRIYEKAEVFTPSWVVKEQVDMIWNGYEGISDIEKICKSWLEITCGEAPYITSRYEMDTGKYIPVQKRVGFLDRKLKLCQTYEDIVLAYKSTYGYEWQGDSLLLARKNLFFTFIENYRMLFAIDPSLDKKLQIAEIIVWNIFQMDGLNFKIPYTTIHCDRCRKNINTKTHPNTHNAVKLFNGEYLFKMYEKSKITILDSNNQPLLF